MILTKFTLHTNKYFIILSENMFNNVLREGIEN